MNVYIDFDYTISPNGYRFTPQILDKPPYKDAVETIQYFKSRGCTIFIFSCRANKEVVGEQVVAMKIKEMTDYLTKHNIPFDHIYTEKPNYDLVIDDKALGFHDNWSEIKKKLEEY
jgi:hypothetical protein